MPRSPFSGARKWKEPGNREASTEYLLHPPSPPLPKCRILESSANGVCRRQSQLGLPTPCSAAQARSHARSSLRQACYSDDSRARAATSRPGGGRRGQRSTHPGRSPGRSAPRRLNAVVRKVRCTKAASSATRCHCRVRIRGRRFDRRNRGLQRIGEWHPQCRRVYLRRGERTQQSSRNVNVNLTSGLCCGARIEE